MAYQWPLEPHDLFVERGPQMLNTGLPTSDVDTVRGAITEMWADRPGGWVYEWSRLAARYAAEGRHDLAVLAYGWAKFPCLADDAKRVALRRQLEQLQLAAPASGVGFERLVLDVPYFGGTTPVPIHVVTPPGVSPDAPVLLASGGVDTWKMDAHQIFVLLARLTSMRLLAFDIAGTGESVVPMTPDGGAEIVRGLVAHARSRSVGNGTVVHLGLSMGGHYSARSGLSGDVDAAVVWGGPVEAAFARREARFGMDGIVGNALGFDAPPSADALAARLGSFSLRRLLDGSTNAPMLVVNGADDVHVPRHDALVFEGRAATEVRLIPDAGHCATTKLPEVLTLVVEWIRTTLS